MTSRPEAGEIEQKLFIIVWRNVGKVFSEQQKQKENPTEWLERLKKSFQLYLGVDPNLEIVQGLLKTQFVAKAWLDIRKKLEKMGRIRDWMNC